MTAPDLRDRLMGSLVGVLVGDALGVPVEFTGRAMRDQDPVTGMRGHGTWNQPPGTWSDDGAMTLVTADVLATCGWNLAKFMDGFLGWLDEGLWAAHGRAFDIGNRTRNSLTLYRIDHEVRDCGGDEERDNGNGSLMRCQPISCWLFGSPLEEMMVKAGEASALTHAHPRSRLCCAWHALWCDAILSGRDVRAAARYASDRLRRHVPSGERPYLADMLEGLVFDRKRKHLASDGYVVSTIAASLWCLKQHGDFRSATLAAVNLGGDTDTTAAVTGGMAGLRGGLTSIPLEWVKALPRNDEIMALANRFTDACLEHWSRHGTC